MSPLSLRKGTTNRAFTLIELMVVLAILSALTLVAIRSLGPIEQRSRFEATQRILRDVESSILGERLADGTFLAGFVADLGALPGRTDDSLLPLLEKPPGVAMSHLAIDSLDREVVLAAGWRGPYLQLQPGETKVLDGWKEALSLDIRTEHYSITSFGADGSPSGAGTFDLDTRLTLIDLDSAGNGIDRVHASVSLTVIVTGEGPSNEIGSFGESDSLRVSAYAYSPNPVNGEVEALVLSSSIPFTVADLPYEETFQFVGTEALTIGPRSFRAYVNLANVPTDPRIGQAQKSSILRRTLQPGAQGFDLAVEIR